MRWKPFERSKSIIVSHSLYSIKFILFKNYFVNIVFSYLIGTRGLAYLIILFLSFLGFGGATFLLGFFQSFLQKKKYQKFVLFCLPHKGTPLPKTNIYKIKSTVWEMWQIAIRIHSDILYLFTYIKREYSYS